MNTWRERKGSNPIKQVLAKVMSSSAIELANSAVDNVISQRLQGSGSRQGKNTQFIVYFHMYLIQS